MVPEEDYRLDIKVPVLCCGTCWCYAWTMSCICIGCCCCRWLFPGEKWKTILYVLAFPLTLIVIVIFLLVGMMTDLLMFIIYIITFFHCCHAQCFKCITDVRCVIIEYPAKELFDSFCA